MERYTFHSECIDVPGRVPLGWLDILELRRRHFIISTQKTAEEYYRSAGLSWLANLVHYKEEVLTWMPPSAQRLTPNVHEHHRRPLADPVRNLGRVPVCQPDASVGRGVADRLRIARAVNSIVFLAQRHPHHADRRVRPRFEVGVGIRVRDLGVERRIVVKVRVVNDLDDIKPLLR